MITGTTGAETLGFTGGSTAGTLLTRGTSAGGTGTAKAGFMGGRTAGDFVGRGTSGFKTGLGMGSAAIGACSAAGFSEGVFAFGVLCGVFLRWHFKLLNLAQSCLSILRINAAGPCVAESAGCAKRHKAKIKIDALRNFISIQSLKAPPPTVSFARETTCFAA